jgi:hypothetical protein
MRLVGMLVTVSDSTRRLGLVIAVPLLILAAPVAASARPGVVPHARGAASAGAVYGGFTGQGFPVIVEMNKSRRRVVRIGIGIRMTCTSGGGFAVADRYDDVKVSKTGRFSSSFRDTNRNDDGTTFDREGSISGRLNKARTKISGRWSVKVTDHDLAGAVTDTCDASNISWSAKQ